MYTVICLQDRWKHVVTITRAEHLWVDGNFIVLTFDSEMSVSIEVIKFRKIRVYEI